MNGKHVRNWGQAEEARRWQHHATNLLSRPGYYSDLLYSMTWWSYSKWEIVRLTLSIPSWMIMSIKGISASKCIHEIYCSHRTAHMSCSACYTCGLKNMVPEHLYPPHGHHKCRHLTNYFTFKLQCTPRLICALYIIDWWLHQANTNTPSESTTHGIVLLNASSGDHE